MITSTRKNNTLKKTEEKRKYVVKTIKTLKYFKRKKKETQKKIVEKLFKTN